MRIILKLCVILSFLIYECVSVGVMGIDFGTDWFKVAVVKPGIPLEVVLNKESKRKTETVVTIRNGIRYFGSDAVSFGVKRPQESYGKLKVLLGHSYDDAIAEEYRKLFDNTMLKNENRSTIDFRQDENTVFSVEELIAMQLSHAKDQCAKYAGEEIKDAVITVPPFWTQRERRALLDAAELAGLNVLTLLNDETSVAINYAMTRTFDEPQYHLFYDVGAGSTVASLVEFSFVPDKNSKPKKPVGTTYVDVKAIGYDRTLGGHEIDLVLQRRLVKDFNEKHGSKVKTEVTKSLKAMAKLLKEANRVKHILSANTDTTASVEGLHEEIDFKTKITRKEMLDDIKDLLDRVADPINSVLASANVTLSQVKHVVLVGGGARVPALLSRLEELVGADKIAKHVNADEAVVLGAAFHGASISPQFRVKKIVIKDVLPFPIMMTSTSSSDKEIKQRLYAKFSNLGSKKKITFKKQTDFSFSLGYPEDLLESDKLLGPLELLNVKVEGVKEALDGINKTLKIKDQKIKAIVNLDEFGLVSVRDVQVETEIVKEKSIGGQIADTVMSFFGSGANKTEDNANDSSKKNQTANDSVNSTVADATEEKETTKIEFTNLNYTVIVNELPPMSEENKAFCKSRLSEMDAEDAERARHEESKNNLESFIYKSNDYLSSDTTPKFSTEEERSTYELEVQSASSWLYDEVVDSTPTFEIVGRYNKLKKHYDTIKNREVESQCRPDAIKSVRNALKSANDVLFKEYLNVTETDRLYTLEDYNKTSNALSDIEKWLEDKVQSQSKLNSSDNPVLLCSQLKDKAAAVNREVKFFRYRKKKKSTSSSATSTTATSEKSDAQSSTKPVPTETNVDEDVEDQDETSTTKSPEPTETASSDTKGDERDEL